MYSKLMGELPSELFISNNKDQNFEGHSMNTSSRGGLGLKLTKASMLIDSHSHVGVQPRTITTTTYIMSRLFCTRLGIHS